MSRFPVTTYQPKTLQNMVAQKLVGLKRPGAWMHWTPQHIEYAAAQRGLDLEFMGVDNGTTGQQLASILWWHEIDGEPEIYPLLRNWAGWKGYEDAFKRSVADALRGTGNYLFDWLARSSPQYRDNLLRPTWLGDVAPPHRMIKAMRDQRYSQIQNQPVRRISA